MSWRTNRVTLILRNIGRIFGINKFIVTYLSAGGYEKEYDTAFFNAIRLGDVIWDVGANVGYYTRKFSEQVGDDGAVFAFEPSPKNFDQLTSSCASLNNVTFLRYGLGREIAKQRFQQGDDDLGATSRIVTSGVPKKGGADITDIDVQSGTNLIESSGIAPPNCIKIDVEGFELEVLEGIGEHLRSPEIHVVGIEVHFGILRERGMSNAPKQIEALLTDNDFIVCWPDSSHILALRPST